jgi:hypothetical protein
MAFRVGQKVVCVNDEYNHPNWSNIPNRPVAASIYTVRQIIFGWYDDDREHAAILLDEIKNPVEQWYGEVNPSECPFAAFRFRPVVERKTDISIFTKMLTDERVTS